MHLDDVAIDFPDMQIIIAHPSAGRGRTRRSRVAMHKPNVWIDLSGWSPKYFPPQLVQYANTLLKDRILFGSDYPLITPDRWMKDFEEAGFKPEVMPLHPEGQRDAPARARLTGSQARPGASRAAPTGPGGLAAAGDRQGLTVSLLSTDFTPSVPLAIETALSTLPALSAEPFKVTTPSLVSTSIARPLTSGSARS